MRHGFVAALLVLASLGSAHAVLADDAPPAAKPPDASPGEAAKKDTTRIERAKELVKQLEAAIARAKAATPVDPALLEALLQSIERARALAMPAKPAELTAEEKKAVVEEAKKAEAANPAPKAPDPTADLADRLLAKAFDGADLNEEESIKAKQIVGDWWKENLASTGDSKRQSDLKRRRDDDLEKALGKKKAQKIVNNLNSMGPGRR